MTDNENGAAIDNRRFPILGGGSIPWRFIEPHGRQVKRNHYQTLEQLAERGGLSHGEIYMVMTDQDWKTGLSKESYQQIELKGKQMVNNLTSAEAEIADLQSRLLAAEAERDEANSFIDQMWSGAAYSSGVAAIEGNPEWVACWQIILDAIDEYRLAREPVTDPSAPLTGTEAEPETKYTELDRLKDVERLARIVVDKSPCRYDHEHYCQVHYQDKPCAEGELIRLLQMQGDEPVTAPSGADGEARREYE
jgi:hypothetical protein